MRRNESRKKPLDFESGGRVRYAVDKQMPAIHHFAEKILVITDADAAAARACALQLALQGSFIIAGTRKATTSSIGSELRELGTLASSVECDPSTTDGAAKLIGEAASAYGRIDLLINSMGVNAETPADDAVQAAVLCIEAALPLMEPRPSPKIVNLFSDVEPVRSRLAELTRSTAAELPLNFRLNAVAISENSPPAADDVARIVHFLLSAEATAVNGQIIEAKKRTAI